MLRIHVKKLSNTQIKRWTHREPEECHNNYGYIFVEPKISGPTLTGFAILETAPALFQKKFKCSQSATVLSSYEARHIHYLESHTSVTFRG